MDVEERTAPALSYAPWSPEQVARLEKRQARSTMHEYTCGNPEKLEDHPSPAVLRPTAEGWVCPYCEYKQNWCHAWDADQDYAKSKIESFLERNQIILSDEQRAEIDGLLD